MNETLKRIVISLTVLLALFMLLYISGLLGQTLNNYEEWQSNGGMSGQTVMRPVDWSVGPCVKNTFSIGGLKSLGLILLAVGGLTAYIKLHDRFGGKTNDPRGFSVSKQGTYGTASWMSDKEMRQVLEAKPIPQAEGIILGEKDGKAICLPVDTRLNRHITICGSSGTMKSRAVIRPALFNIIRRGESTIITDPKGEMYGFSIWSTRNTETPGTVCLT